DDDGYWGDDDGYWGDDDGYWGDDDGYDGYEGASETSRVSIINYTLYGFTRAYVTFAGMGGYGYYDDSFLEGKVLISEYQVTVDVLRDRLVYDLFMVDEDGDEWVWEGITLTDGCEAYVNLTDGGLPKLTVYHLNGDVDEHTGYYK
ncbi:MAG: hypothetical protein FWE70_05300, partial [Oscillospiraceae bacterium]|nr:hypothetical protein [Oscillospiraceae bacterium]